jgi:hypothetical protein
MTKHRNYITCFSLLDFSLRCSRFSPCLLLGFLLAFFIYVCYNFGVEGIIKNFFMRVFIGAWCNGSTADFESVYSGSNPDAPAFFSQTPLMMIIIYHPHNPRNGRSNYDA